MKQWKSLCVFLVMIVAGGLSFAQSPAGTWTTIDDHTGKKRAIVKISESGDTLTGTIVGVYSQPGDIGICVNCPGNFKGKPVKGLQFAWGLKKTGENEWDGGSILDPKTGKIYRAKMTLKGNKLYVRGYLGVSMFGRTQIWVR